MKKRVSHKWRHECNSCFFSYIDPIFYAKYIYNKENFDLKNQSTYIQFQRIRRIRAFKKINKVVKKNGLTLLDSGGLGLELLVPEEAACSKQIIYISIIPNKI